MRKNCPVLIFFFLGKKRLFLEQGSYEMERINWDKKRGKGQREGLGKGVKLGREK